MRRHWSQPLTSPVFRAQRVSLHWWKRYCSPAQLGHDLGALHQCWSLRFGDHRSGRKIRLGKREEMKDEWVSWGAPSNPVLMRAGVHFISKFPLPLAVIKLSYTFFLVFRWQPENTNRRRRHSAGVLWTQECSWTDIWFGFEGNRSELQGAKRRGERIWKVELWFTDYWAFSSPEQL